MSKRKVRTIWISDIHLGTYACKAELLLEFLKTHKAEKIYLVGDIIDGWRMTQKAYWDQHHTAVVKELLTQSKKTEIIYVTGNHDEFLRDFLELGIPNATFHLVDDYIHQGLDGHDYYVTHGDLFDQITRYHKWVAKLGDWAYNVLLRLNNVVHVVRKWFGLPYWSLSAYLKSKTKEAQEFIYAFEDSVVKYAEEQGCRGAICGHIHTPVIKEIDGMIYMNDGDWVESCSALVETYDGEFELVQYTSNS